MAEHFYHPDINPEFLEVLTEEEWDYEWCTLHITVLYKGVVIRKDKYNIHK